MSELDMQSAEASASIVQQRISDGYTSAGGTQVGAFPWQAIIQFVLSLLGGGGICPSPTPTPAKDPVQAATEAKAKMDAHPLACQMMLTDAYLQQGLAPTRREARFLAHGTVSGAKATTVDEMASMAKSAAAMKAAVDAIPV